ncbi:hypothetical protein [Methylosinus sp. LW3]|uniref:hypothetical protein n=1 Tax=Methylosinus sp. LW3 TaxID=107635 RepID=UPI001FD9CEFC|nr:hypothetical protein [Methylosinus sp. LW3]
MRAARKGRTHGLPRLRRPAECGHAGRERPHWRHKAGDCDRWSEPEGPWNLGWKERFDLSCREIVLIDTATGERHRADILCGAGTPRATVLELQHSSITEEERAAREAFYRQERRMFWLIHSESSFLAHDFGMSMDFSTRRVELGGKTFAVMHWMGGAFNSSKNGSVLARTYSSIGAVIFSILPARRRPNDWAAHFSAASSRWASFRAMTSSVLSTGPTDLRRQRLSSRASWLARSVECQA